MTERFDALKDSALSVADRVCFAASDYVLALSNKDFAEANGGREPLLDDLRLAVADWQATLCA